MNLRFNGSRYHGDPLAEVVDFRNNVVFNWGFNSACGGEEGNQNLVKNYYKAGPATARERKNTGSSIQSHLMGCGMWLEI